MNQVKELPSNVDAEKTLIGLALVEKRIPNGALDVSTADFYSAHYRRIWSAFLELDADGREIDPFAAFEIIKRDNAIGLQLADLTSALIGMVSVNAVPVVKRIKSCASRRYVIHELYGQIEGLSTGNQTIGELKRKIDSIDTTLSGKANFKSLSEILEKEVKPALVELRKGEARKISTGFDSIDNAIGGGLSLSDILLVAGIPGGGKALALDTEIPTPDGWTTMGKIDVGDVVFDENGLPCNVVSATSVMYDRECYKVIFSDKTEIIADADHQWLTSTRSSRKSAATATLNGRNSGRPLKLYGSDQTHKRKYPTVVTTKEIAETLTAENGKRLNHAIDVCGSLELESQQLPIPPYTLGAWLGDGASALGRISSNDPEIISQIQQDGFCVNKLSAQYDYGILGLKVKLREIGVLGFKHIPAVYKRGSTYQRLALLQGLMDTDGYCDSRGQCEFTSTNYLLAQDVLEVINSLGIKAAITEGWATLYGRKISRKYRIKFLTGLEAFRLERKLQKQKRVDFRGTSNVRYIKSVEKIESVPVRCIEVDSPSHLYLASASFIPTHNSAFVLQMAVNIAKQNIPVAFLSGEMSNRENAFRLLSQYAKRYNLNSVTDISDGELRGYTQLADELKQLPMYFDSKTYDLQTLAAGLRTLIEESGVKVLVIDYIQLLKLNRFERNTRYERITECSQEVKRIAMEMEVAVIEVAQFNREGAKSVKPSMHDLEGSSQLEKDISLCFIIDREEQSDLVSLRIVKGRNTGLCVIPGRFTGSTLNFEF